MYEFLDTGMEYSKLDEFQKHKADWLQEMKRYSYSTKETYWGLLNSKINPQENIRGKDLFDWDKQEIIKLFKYTPTTKKATKFSLYSTIVKYMDWACEKGMNYVGNPCDTLDTRELCTINEVALRESYKTLKDFYNFILELNCTDVDRMMFTLLRYGVPITEVGTVKWEDVDKAKSCDTYVTSKTSKSQEDYLDFDYIIKVPISASWKYMSDREVYNRTGRISKSNKISRISVPELNVNRKYDLLFDRLDKNKQLSNYGIHEVLDILTKASSPAKRVSLIRDFEVISDIGIRKVKLSNEEKRLNKGFVVLEDENETNESDDKTEQINTNDIDDFVDNEDSNYQNEVAKASKDSNVDTSNHEYKPKDKKSNQANTSKNTYHRNSKVGALALKLANYECSLNKRYETFISNTTSKNYVEAHHLIPIKYYYYSELKKV